MTTLTKPSGPTAVPSLRPAVEVRKAKPVKWWALVGVLFLTVEVYSIAAWFISGNAKPTPRGPTPVPTSHLVMIRFWEAVGVVAAVVCVYFFVVRPWRRERRLTFDGMIAIALLTAFWQDLWTNWTQTTFVYSSVAINLGGWAGNIPGWSSPNGNLVPEPLLWMWPAYVWMALPGMIIANAFMRKVKQRWPQMGVAGVVFSCFLLVCVLDFVLENLWIRSGLYAYPSAIRSLTLWAGSEHQFPLYELLLWPPGWAVLCALRFYRNDKGESVCERGVDEVRASPKQKQGLRLLAVIGIVNVIFLMYNIPAQLTALHADEWPKGIVEKSYMTDGLCGPGTTYACPGSEVPIPRKDSAHLGPDGELVVPPEARSSDLFSGASPDSRDAEDGRSGGTRGEAAEGTDDGE